MFAEQKIFPIFVPPKDINEQRHETDYIKNNIDICDHIYKTASNRSCFASLCLK